MRLLRSLELALATSAAAVLLIAGCWRPSGLVAERAPLGAAPGATVDARPHAAPATAEAPAPVASRDVLDAAARRHNLPPHLVEALAFWESGWDQRRESSTGAVGLMQVQPEVAAELGPRLLGRRVNLHDPRDNAEMGAAILRAYIDGQGGNTWKGLAAYYQGPQSLHDDGPYPDTTAYANGIQAIADRLDHGQPPV